MTAAPIARPHCKECAGYGEPEPRVALQLTLLQAIKEVDKARGKNVRKVWGAQEARAQGKVGRDAAVIIKLPRLGYLIRVALDAMGAAEEP